MQVLVQIAKTRRFRAQGQQIDASISGAIMGDVVKQVNAVAKLQPRFSSN